MTKESETQFKRAVAQYYDNKKEDFNFLLAQSDGLVHHHNGICLPGTTFPEDMTEETTLQTLHHLENNLVEQGTEALGRIDPSMIGLDAGCGRGASSFMIARKSGCSIIGINISPYQVEFAKVQSKKQGLNNLTEFILGDMVETPFKNNQFDFVWACESTEHIPDLSKMFNEFKRIIKPNSTLLIVAWCANFNHPEAKEIIDKLNKAYVGCAHSRNEYLESSAGSGWNLDFLQDLTSLTIPYWGLRARSANSPGTEPFMFRGFRNGVLEYNLFKFRKSANP